MGTLNFNLCLGYMDHSDLGLSIKTDMNTIVKVMASPDSGLVVRDRMWLKITIPNAFIGSFMSIVCYFFSTMFNKSKSRLIIY